MSATGLILFGHGARDPRWAEPMQRMQARIAAKVPQVLVELAFLEVMEPGLPVATKRLVDRGCERIVIVPVFVGQGGHVRRDLATLVESLRRQYPELNIAAVDAVGEDDSVLDALAAYCMKAIQSI